MKWKPVWDICTTMKTTIEWYKNYYDNKVIQTQQDIRSYVNDAQKQKLSWAN